MTIDCYLSEHCGSYHELRENLDIALRELGLSVEPVFHTVSYDEAVALGIPGSPTIRVNGRDLYESPHAPGVA